MKKYIQAVNFGNGFITHEDQEVTGLSFAGYPGDVWVSNGDEAILNAWSARVLGSEKTQEEAQALVDATNPKDMDGNLITITLP